MRALLVDFDGVVIDSETSDYEAWRFVYARHGVEMPRAEWVARIGSDGSGFDPLAHLVERARGPLEVEELQADRRRRRDELLYALRPLPGVVDWLEAGRAAGLRLAIVSSSPHEWVDGLLRHVSLRSHFELLVTREHVSQVKPHPELYETALRRLGIDAHEAFALEDSPNGVRAATRAGLRCVVVPGPMTRDLAFDAAHLRLGSLAEQSLDQVLARLPHGGPEAPG